MCNCLCTLLLLLLISGLSFSSSSSSLSLHDSNVIPNPHPRADSPSPNLFTVRFYTNVVDNGAIALPFEMNITRSWAPLGADRFYSLVKDNYFTNATFFRIVPDFVLQFGIASNSKESSKWKTSIKDDPVVMTNSKWSVSYATSGANTRSTHLFINYGDNGSLDLQGFAPFGEITSGFETLLLLRNPTPGIDDGISQTSIYKYGTEWVKDHYPLTNYITYATVIFEDNINDEFIEGNMHGRSKMTTVIIISVMVVLGLLMVGAVLQYQYQCLCKRFCAKYKPMNQEEEYADKAFEMGKL